ncbi:MAG: glucose-6-phosphate dehydrogenase, partial [Pseudomonadales bacterium]|nr:glucose-6-phosphate dehydrogenase [Pseudomonadales bacterium]
MSESNIDLVVFGGLGDLAGRKLLPALYQIERAGLFAESIRVAIVAREDIETSGFLRYAEERLKASLPAEDWSDAVWARLGRRCSYLKIDFSNQKQFEVLSA